jgi:hypothetical protein
MTVKPPIGPVKPETPAPPEPEGFAEAHRTLISDASIQFDLPMFQPPPQPPPSSPGWLQWLGDFLSADHPILRLLLWALLAAAALAILWLVARRLAASDRWRRNVPAADADDAWRPAAAPALALLGEADALAARGRFAEAVHLLLFRSIADLDERRPGLVRPALTSRDISALDEIPSGPRGAFARIATLVEYSLFARRSLAEADWRASRAAYEEFAFAEGWRG